MAEGMYPKPPALAGAAKRFAPGELLWIPRNGIKMSGMPSWADHGDDELVGPRRLSGGAAGHGRAAIPGAGRTVRIGMAIANRRIEIAREAMADGCLRRAYLDHYRRHAA